MIARLRKYLLFFVMGPLVSLLWAFWVLPQVGEEGSFPQTLQWIAVQILLPFFLSGLLCVGRRYAHWLVLAYSVFLLLHGLGLVGWGLLGAFTPISIYLVGGLLLTMGFGLFYHALGYLGFGKKERRTYEDE